MGTLLCCGVLSRGRGRGRGVLFYVSDETFLGDTVRSQPFARNRRGCCVRACVCENIAFTFSGLPYFSHRRYFLDTNYIYMLGSCMNIQAGIQKMNFQPVLSRYHRVYLPS